jgi:anti-sigma B factor antagonist
MSNLITNEKIENNEAIIELSDSLIGGSDAMSFQSRLTEIVKSGTTSIKLDLHNVETINSSGLGMIVAAHSNLRKDNASLILTKIPAKVAELIKMTHLDSVQHSRNLHLGDQQFSLYLHLPIESRLLNLLP